MILLLCLMGLTSISICSFRCIEFKSYSLFQDFFTFLRPTKILFATHRWDATHSLGNAVLSTYFVSKIKWLSAIALANTILCQVRFVDGTDRIWLVFQLAVNTNITSLLSSHSQRSAETFSFIFHNFNYKCSIKKAYLLRMRQIKLSSFWGKYS